ncbi:hypothetical protein [Pectinatus brassicae]|uniref:Uncharacterized protein n=1 Tax=Pectinatus brassicae TaxID=862415 RepID=A0A840UG22_9FIRM|nr:hypothetical protein [Pectinatus brassicae]MBB5336056.1 hypothetical protein [Pectinatus brassicae]
MNKLKAQIILVITAIMLFQGLIISTGSAFALSDSNGEKARAFNKTFVDADIHKQDTEATVLLDNCTKERAREFAKFKVQFDLARKYEAQIYKENLGLDNNIFSVSANDIPVQEISEKIENKEINGKVKDYMIVIFRQKKFDSNKFNPFIEKEISIRPAVIKKVDHIGKVWTIEAEGYGYYESADNIDRKATVAAHMAQKAAFDIVIKKAVELKLIKPDNKKDFQQPLAVKNHQSGVYKPSGCGVYFTKTIKVEIDANGKILDEE